MKFFFAFIYLTFVFKHFEHWERLKLAVMHTDLIVDKLVFKDVQLTATNDDQYFVFEDVLYQIMLCFSRDTEINNVLNPTDSANAPIPKGLQYEGPPSGIVPFHGICMFGKFENPFFYKDLNNVSLFLSCPVLLSFRFTGSIVFRISCVLYSVLSSIDDDKYASASKRPPKIGLNLVKIIVCFFSGNC